MSFARIDRSTDRTSPSERAKRRLQAPNQGPLFVADWLRALMIHYETDPAVLQPQVPFPLDLRNGRAHVSLVAFTQSSMRPYRGGRFFDRFLRPIATHEFLNLRTYVRVGSEPGIFFLAEWLPNRFAVMLGPRTYGLPYRLGRLRYDHDHHTGHLRGVVLPGKASGPLVYSGRIDPDARFAPSPTGSLTEFLMERYTAFTSRGRTRRAFRVWHAPWLQAEVIATVYDDRLLAASGPWYQRSKRIGANYSPGLQDVWLGPPRSLPIRPAAAPQSHLICAAQR